MAEPARILVADDHPLVRAGVLEALAGLDFCQVVGEASSAAQAVELVARLQPDLLILDLKMEADAPAPHLLIGTCTRLQPDLKILILSAHTEARELLTLQDVAYHGFVTKTEGIQWLPQAVRSLLAGETWFSHDAAQSIARNRTRSDSVLRSLTQQELTVLQHMREAKDNHAIAEEMGISPHTVRRHATMIYQKLGVKNRMEAIVLLDHELAREAPLDRSQIP